MCTMSTYIWAIYLQGSPTSLFSPRVSKSTLPLLLVELYIPPEGPLVQDLQANSGSCSGSGAVGDSYLNPLSPMVR